MISKSRTLKIIWVGALVVTFSIFSFWYGGKGQPITAEEGASLIAQLRASYAPSEESDHGLAGHLEEMIAKDDGREFYAVNLEKLKHGDAARKADRAYAQAVMPLLFKRGSHPVFVSDRAGLMLGKYGEQVDRVAVVRYRSLRDLLTMTIEPSMIENSHYKFAALEHTEVFITRPFISFMQVKVLVAFALALLGWLGLSVINLIRDRRRRV